jgi:hypothetical protein
MPSYSVLNLDARFSVSQELTLVFLEVWTARCEETVLGMFGSRLAAEHACYWSASQECCLEEA